MIERRSLIFVSLFLAALLWFMHQMAVIGHLYWTIWWYDIPVHIIGGMMLGLIGLWLFSRDNFFGNARKQSFTFVIALAFSIVWGIIWELLEYSIGFTVNTIGSYPLDTLKDVLMDIVGGFLAFVYIGGLNPENDKENKL